MVVPDANPSRPVAFLKQSCGFSTRVRNGICCRKAIQLQNGTSALSGLVPRDATFVMAKGGGAEIGTTKRGKGMKIMAIVDRHGLPLSVSTHAANHHEVSLAQLCFDFYMIEAKPENLVGDRAYDRILWMKNCVETASR